jgi:F-type H+-transporting ATPase subunit delta
MPEAVTYRYAKALADAVLDPGSQLDPAQARVELANLDQLVRDSAELRNVLLSPAVPAARKRAVVGRFAGELRVSRLVRNFLFVLIDRRRIAMLSDVRAAFEAELDSRLGIVRANVSTAMPVDDAQRRDVESSLARLTGKQVRAEFDVNPALIGGAVVRIGTTIYDGSIRGQLETLRSRLVS